MPSLTCELTIDVMGGPDMRHCELSDVELRVEVDAAGWADCPGVTWDQIECIAIGPRGYEWIRPSPVLALVYAQTINASEEYRDRIAAAIRDAGGADALHERARAGLVMKRAAEG